MKLLPNNWMNAIWGSDLPFHAKGIAAFLRSHMHNNKGFAHPSYSRMQKRLGITRATLAKYLDVLELNGWITRKRGSYTSATSYYIAIPKKKIEEFSESLKAQASSTDELGVAVCGLPNELLNSSKGSSSSELDEGSSSPALVHVVSKGSSSPIQGVVHDVNPKKQIEKTKKKQYLREGRNHECENGEFYELPSEINLDAWDDFIEHRIGLTGKKKIDNPRYAAPKTMTIIVNKFKKLSHEGQRYEVDRCLDGEWKSIHPEKKNGKQDTQYSRKLSTAERVAAATGFDMERL